MNMSVLASSAGPPLPSASQTYHGALTAPCLGSSLDSTNLTCLAHRNLLWEHAVKFNWFKLLFKLLVILMTRLPIQRRSLLCLCFRDALRLLPVCKQSASTNKVRILLHMDEGVFDLDPLWKHWSKVHLPTECSQANETIDVDLQYLQIYTLRSVVTLTVILIKWSFILIPKLSLSIKTAMSGAATTWSIYSITVLCQYSVLRICWISLANLMQGCICRAGCVNFGSSCGLFRASPCQACARFWD